MYSIYVRMLLRAKGISEFYYVYIKVLVFHFMSSEAQLKDYYQPPSSVKVKRDGNTATHQYFKEKQDTYLKGEVTFQAIRTEIYNSRASRVNSLKDIRRAEFYKSSGEQKISGTYGLIELETLLEVCWQQIRQKNKDMTAWSNNITSLKATIKTHWDKVSSLYFPFMIQKNDQSANIRIFPIYYKLNDFYVCLSLFGSDDNWFTQGLPIPDNLYLDNPAEEETGHDTRHIQHAEVQESDGIPQQADISTLLCQMRQLCV